MLSWIVKQAHHLIVMMLSDVQMIHAMNLLIAVIIMQMMLTVKTVCGVMELRLVILCLIVKQGHL